MALIGRRRVLAALAAPAFARGRPRIAVTMDDVAWQGIPEARRGEAEARILDAAGSTRVLLFAAGQNVDNQQGSDILKRWSAAGHWIGNHTYNHRALTGSTTPDEFEAGIVQAETVLENCPGFRKWFRFPALKEGETREVRDRLRSFLALHGYRNGAVTVDASDWYYNRRLLDRLQRDPRFDPAAFRQAYLDHIWDRAQYYDRLSRDVVGRRVPHTLLLHYNFLNSLFLGDLLAMFRVKGWGHIGADEAFSDPVFQRLPDIVPAGESLMWALAKESGRYEGRLRYPGESDSYEKPVLDRMGL